MFTVQALRERMAHRNWRIYGTMACGIGPGILFCIGLCFFMCYLGEAQRSPIVNWFGETAFGFMVLALALFVGGIALLSLFLAAKFANRFKIDCPSCQKNISPWAVRVLMTRCCLECNERIVVGGRVHSSEVYGRYRSIHNRHMLQYWFWVWPSAGLFFTIWQLFDRTEFRQHWHYLIMFPLIGAATAGWAWGRTGDRRYLPQWLASIVLLVCAVALIWRAW